MTRLFSLQFGRLEIVARFMFNGLFMWQQSGKKGGGERKGIGFNWFREGTTGESAEL